MVGTMPHRNKVPLVHPHLDGALVSGVVEQVSWYSRRSSYLMRFVSWGVMGYDGIINSGM